MTDQTNDSASGAPSELPPSLAATPPTVAGPIPPPKQSGNLAVASMTCGIVGLAGSLCFTPALMLPVAIAGLICGIMSKDRNSVRTAGLVCSSIAVVLGLGYIAVIIIMLMISGSSGFA
jgi:hypothetical protein